MSLVAHVAIHPSQFPAQVRRDLLQSLRSRQVNHKFHYDSVKQTQKWLALHEAYSPARTDADGQAIYDSGFEAAVKKIAASNVHLIGLGCGGGKKDTRLLELLTQAGKKPSYTPCDVSAAMVLTARAAALATIPAENCHPLVCDLATADDLADVLKEQVNPAAMRLITFFGMIPNFESRVILQKLAALMRRGEFLLFSANLAPGPDYAAGVNRVLPLYDNDLTRDWLMMFLLDIGVEKKDGSLHFAVEEDADGLKRITAHFHLHQKRRVQVDDETFEFRPGESIRLFFSYRHTPDRVRALLDAQGIRVLEQWITKSEEEGVFLCTKG